MNATTKDTAHMNVGYEKNFCELMDNNEMYGYYIYLLMLDGVVIYVGQTKNIIGRLAEYKCRFLKQKCHNEKLQKMFDSGEMKKVRFRIADKAVTLSDAMRKEQDYIAQYRDTCLNKYDTFCSAITRQKISTASRKMWKNPNTRNDIVAGLSKKHVLTAPDGQNLEFSNSYEVKEFLLGFNSHLHKNDRKRIGYQMLESCGENKGWKMVIDGKRPPSKWSRGVLKTPDGEDILINGKWELVNLNRKNKWKLNVNRLMRNGRHNGFSFISTANNA
jgi:hypothetical protein